MTSRRASAARLLFYDGLFRSFFAIRRTFSNSLFPLCFSRPFDVYLARVHVYTLRFLNLSAENPQLCLIWADWSAQQFCLQIQFGVLRERQVLQSGCECWVAPFKDDKDAESNCILFLMQTRLDNTRNYVHPLHKKCWYVVYKLLHFLY